jgi:FtsH-binding integral membrane protein
MDYIKSYSAQYNKGFDEGLRQYMLKVYQYMALALVFTGVFAYASLNFAPLMQMIYNVGPNGEIFGVSGFGTLIMFAPLAISLFFFMKMASMTVQTAQVMLWLYAAVMGMSLSTLGLIYTGQSITKTFFVCASVFGGMSIYGYSTKRDLTSIGSFLVMGVIGIVIAALVNMFLQSAALDFSISLIGIVVFMGLTAWDTQKLKAIYQYSGIDSETREKIAVVGALTLYLDFINLFVYLLRFLGDKKE